MNAFLNITFLINIFPLCFTSAWWIVMKGETPTWVKIGAVFSWLLFAALLLFGTAAAEAEKEAKRKGSPK